MSFLIYTNIPPDGILGKINVYSKENPLIVGKASEPGPILKNARLNPRMLELRVSPK